MNACISPETVSRTSKRTQARIIDAVVEMVAKNGLSGTTLANVAATAGVSQGVLVFHFKSKEGLLTETLVRLLDEYKDAWTRACTAGDPLDRIIGLVGADFDPDICSRKKLALWFSFWGEAGAEPLYNKICTSAEQERARAMYEACAALAGKVATPDPAMLANSIDAHTDGLWLQMHIQGNAFNRSQALDTAFGHLQLLLPEMAYRI